jgi:uncharacterized membrane protein YozB (DUF420 family)
MVRLLQLVTVYLLLTTASANIIEPLVAFSLFIYFINSLVGVMFAVVVITKATNNNTQQHTTHNSNKAQPLFIINFARGVVVSFMFLFISKCIRSWL